jgi:hypothetical protein
MPGPLGKFFVAHASNASEQRNLQMSLTQAQQAHAELLSDGI